MAIKLTKEPVVREYTPVHLLTEEETMSKQAVSPNTKIGVKPSDIDTMIIRECTPTHLMTEEETISKADVIEDITSKDIMVEKETKQTSSLMNMLPSMTIKGVICVIILILKMLCEDNIKVLIGKIAKALGAEEGILEETISMGWGIFNFITLVICMTLMGSIVWQSLKSIMPMFFGDKD